MRMERKALTPTVLVDLKKIPELSTIRAARNGLTIGALALMEEVASSPRVQRRYGVLAEGAAVVGSIQTRNRATVGGNLCNASPAADTAAPLIALSAKVRIAGAPRVREVALEEFFLGPGKTCLKSHELLKEIFIPAPGLRSGGSFQRCTRTAMDIALVNCAVFLSLSAKGSAVKDVRIALGAVGPIPIRARTAEDVLRGNEPDKELVEQAVECAVAAAQPIDDVRASAYYRREMVRVLTWRGIEEALAAAKGEV